MDGELEGCVCCRTRNPRPRRVRVRSTCRSQTQRVLASTDRVLRRVREQRSSVCPSQRALFPTL